MKSLVLCVIHYHPETEAASNSIIIIQIHVINFVKQLCLASQQTRKIEEEQGIKGTKLKRDRGRNVTFDEDFG